MNKCGGGADNKRDLERSLATACDRDGSTGHSGQDNSRIIGVGSIIGVLHH